MAANGLTIFVF